MYQRVGSIYDLDGIRFGKWTATNETKRVGKRTLRLCHCDCGNSAYLDTSNLTGGKTNKCNTCMGLLSQINDGDSVKTSVHNGIYVSYRAMLNRCYLESTNGYSNYGGSGVVVHDDWKNNYLSFKEWSLSNGWKQGLVISRKGDKGNYEPNNCEWITKSQNSKDANIGRKNPNRSLDDDTIRAIRAENVTLKKEGRYTTRDIAKKYGISYGMCEKIRQRIQYKDVV